ncbi:MAG: hypothetical protein A2Y97_09550 [Nitrospirae bacterium RBG_13_39_12]|nr:MAG: hypothetical protein A2Y97_09550 [Nitrospirae bacterium RBG_13_39_12]
MKLKLTIVCGLTKTAISKATLMSFPLVGSPQRLAEERIFLKKPEGLRIPNAFGTMTKSDKNVALLMTALVYQW